MLLDWQVDTVLYISSVPASKPLWCYSVHHWLVNTVQRSPFLKNTVLTTGDSNFAIWRESVLVTTRTNVTASSSRGENFTFSNEPTSRKVPSYCHQTLSKCARRHAGPRQDQPSSTSERRTEELRCGICWRRPANLRLSRSTSPTPRSPASNPGWPSVRCTLTIYTCNRCTIQMLKVLSIDYSLNWHWHPSLKTTLENWFLPNSNCFLTRILFLHSQAALPGCDRWARNAACIRNPKKSQSRLKGRGEFSIFVREEFVLVTEILFFFFPSSTACNKDHNRHLCLSEFLVHSMHASQNVHPADFPSFVPAEHLYGKIL